MRLVGGGTITPMTQVWKDGMADWQLWGSVVGAIFPDSIPCHACNRPLPKDDLGACLFLLSFASLLGAIIVGHRAATILSVHRIGKETITFGRLPPLGNPRSRRTSPVRLAPRVLPPRRAPSGWHQR